MRAFVRSNRRLLESRLWGLAACLLPATAFADDFVVAPTDLVFGSIYVGETAEIDVLIINVSGVPQTPSFAGGAPGDPDNFGGSQSCGGVTLPPGGSCAFTYEFHPVATGLLSSSTSIGIDGAHYAITMVGTGIFPIVVGPLVLDFGNVAVGSSRARPVTFTNVSSVPQAPNYAGGAPFDSDNFGGSQSCGGVTLPPGGSCAFTYEFHPVALGPVVSGTGIDVDNESFSITLVGNGADDPIFSNGFD
jgi:ASPM-SPD-2-Hydin domain-containing protein